MDSSCIDTNQIFRIVTKDDPSFLPGLLLLARSLANTRLWQGSGENTDNPPAASSTKLGASGAISSVGRAPHSHCGGHWFETGIAHHFYSSVFGRRKALPITDTGQPLDIFGYSPRWVLVFSRIDNFSIRRTLHGAIRANPAKAGDAKPRVLASFATPLRRHEGPQDRRAAAPKLQNDRGGVGYA